MRLRPRPPRGRARGRRCAAGARRHRPCCSRGRPRAARRRRSASRSPRSASGAERSLALVAAHHRRAHDGREVHVLAEALDHASPARVAGDVDHRRERPGDAAPSVPPPPPGGRDPRRVRGRRSPPARAARERSCADRGSRRVRSGPGCRAACSRPLRAAARWSRPRTAARTSTPMPPRTSDGGILQPWPEDDLQLAELLVPGHLVRGAPGCGDWSCQGPSLLNAACNGRSPGTGSLGCGGSAIGDLLVPGRVHLVEHLVDRLLSGQQALHADAEGVVDGRVRPAGVRKAGVGARGRAGRRSAAYDGAGSSVSMPVIGTAPERSANCCAFSGSATQSRKACADAFDRVVRRGVDAPTRSSRR